MLRYLKLIASLILAVSMSTSSAQNQEYVIIENYKSYQQRLVLPQKMKFVYDGQKVRYDNIIGFNKSGLVAEDGPVDMDFKKIRAKRLKSKSTKVAGWVLTTLGVVGTLAIAPVVFNENAGGGIVIVSGLAMIIAGPAMLKTKKTYKSKYWHIQLTPTEYVKHPMDDLPIYLKE